MVWDSLDVYEIQLCSTREEKIVAQHYLSQLNFVLILPA